MIEIHSWLYYILALLLLILPPDWAVAIFVSSFLHEMSHILVLKCLQGEILKVKFQVYGCEIETDRIEEWRQVLSILAGPIASFSLLMLCKTVPQLAVCGLLQGLYNLIPILPLDGGRLLRIALYHVCPNRAETLMKFIAICICIVIDILVIWLSVTVVFQIWPILLTSVWNIKMLSGKIPCKQIKIGVQ